MSSGALLFTARRVCIARMPWQDVCPSHGPHYIAKLECATVQLYKKVISNTDTDFIWFTDEKVFSVAVTLNTQNDRVYVPLETRRNVLHRNVSCVHVRRHGARRSFKTRLHRVVFL